MNGITDSNQDIGENIGSAESMKAKHSALVLGAIAKISMIVSVCAITSLFSSKVLADEIPINPAQCMSTIQELDLRYRSRMRHTCFDVPAASCERSDDISACILSFVEMVDKKVEAILESLPNEIDESGLSARRYNVAIERFDELGSISECNSENDDERALCIYILRSVALIEAFRMARLAGIKDF